MYSWQFINNNSRYACYNIHNFANLYTTLIFLWLQVKIIDLKASEYIICCDKHKLKLDWNIKWITVIVLLWKLAKSLKCN